MKLTRRYGQIATLTDQFVPVYSSDIIPEDLLKDMRMKKDVESSGLYLFKITKFRNITECYTPYFFCAGRRWKMLLRKNRESHLSLYLDFPMTQEAEVGIPVHMAFFLCEQSNNDILRLDRDFMPLGGYDDSRKDINNLKVTNCRYEGDLHDWGFFKFLNIGDLDDSCYIVDDSLLFGVAIVIINDPKDIVTSAKIEPTSNKEVNIIDQSVPIPNLGLGYELLNLAKILYDENGQEIETILKTQFVKDVTLKVNVNNETKVIRSMLFRALDQLLDGKTEIEIACENKDVPVILSTLNAIPHIRSLGIYPASENVEFSDESIFSILKYADSHCLGVLNLKGVNLSRDESVAGVCKFLTNNKRLASLNLEYCNLNDNGVHLILTSLETNYHLNRLYLDDNHDITEDVFPSIEKLLSNNNTLQLVSLSKCGITSSCLNKWKEKLQKFGHIIVFEGNPTIHVPPNFNESNQVVNVEHRASQLAVIQHDHLATIASLGEALRNIEASTGAVHIKNTAAMEKCLEVEKRRLDQMKKDLERWKIDVREKPLKRLTVDDVYLIFQQIGLPISYGIIKSNNINGDRFSKLLEQDFPVMLHIHQLGDIKRAVEARCMLMNKQGFVKAKSGNKPDKSNVLEWTVDDVCTWLKKNGLEKWKDLFHRHKLDGSVLFSIKDNDIRNVLEVTNIDERSAIMEGIGKLEKAHRNGAAVFPDRNLEDSLNSDESTDTQGSAVIAPHPEIQKEIVNLQKRLRDAYGNAIDSDDIPEDFLCPISKLVMLDPVNASDGYAYERSMIELWFQNHDTSPITGEIITKVVIPAKIMKRQLNSHFNL